MIVFQLRLASLEPRAPSKPRPIESETKHEYNTSSRACNQKHLKNRKTFLKIYWIFFSFLFFLFFFVNLQFELIRVLACTLSWIATFLIACFTIAFKKNKNPRGIPLQFTSYLKGSLLQRNKIEHKISSKMRDPGLRFKAFITQKVGDPVLQNKGTLLLKINSAYLPTFH